jgi:hypothetical protein
MQRSCGCRHGGLHDQLVVTKSSNCVDIWSRKSVLGESLYGAAIGGTTANVTITSQYCTKNGGGPATVTPKIRLGGTSGTDITGTTQAVLVGQQIVLYADYTLPSGQNPNSQSWSVLGNRVGGFSTASTNGGPTAVNNNGQSTTFYWVAAANSQTATFTLNYGSNQTATAKATFNISGPTSVSAQATVGQWQIQTSVNGPELDFGLPIGTRDFRKQVCILA